MNEKMEPQTKYQQHKPASFAYKIVSNVEGYHNDRIQDLHRITMCLTVDFAWDAEIYGTNKSTMDTRLEKEKQI